MSRDKHRPPRGEYEVGRGKPPQHTQFKKGQSGNPNGRARMRLSGIERAKQMLLEEAYRPVSVREGETIRKMPALQAVIRSKMNLAAKGNRLAQQAVLKMIQSIEQEKEADRAQLMEAAIEYKIGAERDIAQRKLKGTYREGDVTPHPDDILIDMETGRVFMRELPFARDRWRIRLREQLDRVGPKKRRKPK